MGTRFFPNYDGYIITSRFGTRVHPVTKVKKTHNGIDFVASNDGKTGQVDDIKAHTGGTVYAVGYGTSAGNYIKIQVADGAIMVYYHLKSKPNFKKGNTVKQGQVIGRMGKTGTVTGAHLHWGIQKDGKWIDPEPYLDTDYIATCTVTLPVLERGNKGDTVKAMQQLLIAKGYGCGTSGDDGSFGGATEGALTIYQKAKGLEQDGVCGPATWGKLLGV